MVRRLRLLMRSFACIGQLCKTRDYGRYYATCYTAVSFGCLNGIPIAGESMERCRGEYWDLIMFTGNCYVGALLQRLQSQGLSEGWSSESFLD
ncbi:hypothetical protein N431DRAFT_106050 [Stipitochalara longipes BDJ]|nr:hypothetical protein N431DRAFT_106050 [Stipitochalara longipes BDJ]